jgi:hypothetical protein
MKRERFQEYLAREGDVAARLLPQRIGDLGPLEHLYPEYNLDRASRLVSTSLEPYSKLWELVPFREKLVVRVTVRNATAAGFRELHGVDVAELLEFVKLGRVLMMINTPRELGEDTPEFLDPILNLNPPSSVRLSRVTDLLEEVDKATADRVGTKFRKLTTVAVDGSSDLSGEGAYSTTRSLVRQLLLLGRRTDVITVEGLLDAGRSEEARRSLEFLRLFVVGPSFYSFNRLHNVSGNAVGPTRTYPRGVIEGIDVFDSRLARLLIRRLHLYRPASFIECLDVYRDYAKARKALAEADAWVARRWGGDPDDLPTTESLEMVFDELLQSYDRRSRLVEVAFWAMDLGLVALPGGAVPAIVLGAAKGGPQLVARLRGEPDPYATAAAGIATAPRMRTIFGIHARARRAIR